MHDSREAERMVPFASMHVELTVYLNETSLLITAKFCMHIEVLVPVICHAYTTPLLLHCTLYIY
jgi:hypothetical protein